MRLKKCSKCKRQKQLSEFTKNKHNKDGYAYYCRLCKKDVSDKHYKNPDNYKKLKKSSKNWSKNNLDKCKIKNKRYDSSIQGKINRRMYSLKWRYGISLEDYNKMFEEQQGCCAICETHVTELSKQLCVDHRHFDSKVRGLLCNSCNLLLGNSKDSIKILQNAIKYLGKYNG